MTTRYLNASKTTRRSPNYESGRGGSNITGITIHWWDNPAKAPSFDGVVSWLCNPAAQVSAHFVVEDSRVACLVHPRNKAWHARSGNTGTIGIECNPRASQADRDTLVGLIVALWLNYGKVPLYKHNHWVQTDCPGVYGTTYWQQINDDANRLMLAVQHDAARRASYRKAWWNSISSGTGTSFSPGSNITHQTVTVDGYWGSDTTRALQRIMGTPQDGVVSSQDVYWKSKNPGLTSGWEWVNNATGSQLIAKLQTRWGASPADGIIGSGTIRAMQKYYGTTVDGTLDEGSSAIMAMQRWINDKLAPTPTLTPPSTGGNGGSGGSTGGSSTSLVVDGYWGIDTTRALQKKYGTPQDGVISSQDVYWKSKNPGLTGGWEWVRNASGSQLIARLQKEWGIPNGDGIIGPNTIKAMQRHYKVAVTGTLTENAPAIRKMQEQLRQGTKPNTSGSGSTPTPKPTVNNSGKLTVGSISSSTDYGKLDVVSLIWHLEKRIEELRSKYPKFGIREEEGARNHSVKRKISTANIILNYFSKKYLEDSTRWGLSAEFFMANEASILERDATAFKILNFLAPYLDEGNNELVDKIGGMVDLPHFAVTTLGYWNINFLVPDRWTGWAGDAVTAAIDLKNLHKAHPKMDVLKGAEAIVGNSTSTMLQKLKTAGANAPDFNSSFGLADLCGDSDAIYFANVLTWSNYAPHALSEQMLKYFSDSTLLKKRYAQIAVSMAGFEGVTLADKMLRSIVVNTPLHFAYMFKNDVFATVYLPAICAALAKKVTATI